MEINKHRKQFGNNATDYTRYRKPYIKELYKYLFDLLPQCNVKILDVACGTGKSTEPQVNKNTVVFGCDHDELMIKEARTQAQSKNLNIEYSVADVENLPFEDNTFDVITVGTAFHWFVNKESINEIKRVLKPQGLLFIYWILSKNKPQNDEIPSDIFRSYHWNKVPSDLRNLEYISNFFKNNSIDNVKTQIMPYSFNATVEDMVGLQKTASSYELLLDSDKQEFLNEVCEALTQKLGNREYLSYEEEVCICYGFKS